MVLRRRRHPQPRKPRTEPVHRALVAGLVGSLFIAAAVSVWRYPVEQTLPLPQDRRVSGFEVTSPAKPLQRSEAFLRLKPETQKRLLEMMGRGDSGQRLNEVVQKRYEQARSRGMSDSAFDQLLYSALSSCAP